MRTLLARVGRDYSAHGCVTHGAALAFYALFVLLPVPIFAVSLAAALVGRAEAGSETIDVLRALAGDQVAETLREALATASELTSWRGAHGFGLISILFGSTAFFVELQEILNKIWDVPATSFRWSSYLRSRLVSFVMVVASGGSLLVLTLLSAAFRVFGQKLDAVFPLPAVSFSLLSFLVPLLAITVMFCLVFCYVPETEISFRDVWLGGLGTALLQVCGNELLGLYLQHTRLATAYGAAGSLVLTLTWVYYSSLAFLLGAEVTRQLGLRRAARGRPIHSTGER